MPLVVVKILWHECSRLSHTSDFYIVSCHKTSDTVNFRTSARDEITSLIIHDEYFEWVTSARHVNNGLERDLRRKIIVIIIWVFSKLVSWETSHCVWVIHGDKMWNVLKASQNFENQGSS